MKVPRHLQLEEIKVPPGQEWTDTAAVWHFLHVSGGAAYWLGDNRTRSLIEGEMIIVAPAVKGAVRASQIGEVTLHVFNFAPDLLCGLFTLAERHFFESSGGELLRSVQFLPSTHPANRQFAALIESDLKPNSLAQRIEALSLIAAVFDQDVAQHHTPVSLGTTALHRFHQLIAEMPDSEIINHSPEQLARLCGCSPRHFNRLFRKYFGASARARQTELRLLKARQLLCDTEAKIVQVAMDSGYRNLSLFNSLFKKRFGMTPSGWRRRAINSNGNSAE
jgi:AraC-like DNA-binding protein